MSEIRRLMVAMALSTGMACGHAQPTPIAPESGPLAGELVDAEGKPAPKWVTAPSSYRKDDDDNKVLCSEGSMEGTGNMSMAQSASAGRARTALARELDLKVKSMLKDYQATTTGGANFASAANDEQHVVDAAKQVTDTTLSGTEVSQTWISSRSTLHTLVCLNVERFKGIVGGMAQLDEAVRAAVVQRADAAWTELDDVTAR